MIKTASNKLFRIVALVSLLVLVSSSGGSAGRKAPAIHPNAVPAILYTSQQALDGSDNVLLTRFTIHIRNGLEPVSNIWVINTDGSSMPLTRLMVESKEPVWSPDGRKIAFTSRRALDGSNASNGINSHSVENIWVMNADGSGAMPLTKWQRCYGHSPVWSPDGRKIAFVARCAFDGKDTFVNNENIWVMNSDGSSLKAITKLIQAYSEEPAWSPDGSKIAFRSSRALDGSDADESHYIDNIWLMKADGSQPVPLTKITLRNKPHTGHKLGYDGQSLNQDLAWSPDGRMIAFTSRGPSPYSFRVLDPNHPDYYDERSSFNRQDRWYIWVVNSAPPDESQPNSTDGSTARVVFWGGQFSYRPVWSPDGSRIAFSSDTPLPIDSEQISSQDSGNIWIVNVDGSKATPLTHSRASWITTYNPAWSPDGKRIAFESTRNLDGSEETKGSGVFNIWIMNADGSDPTALTKLTKANSSSPMWRPSVTP